MLSQLSRRQVAAARPSTARIASVRRPSVRVKLFNRNGPVLVEEAAVDEFNQPTKRQREALKRSLVELGFTEQAADILAFSKITNSNADLLIGDIRASFGVYQPPPPQNAVESVQNGVQDLLQRLRLPFLGLVLAAGTAALISNRESLGLLPATDSIAENVADALLVALDELADVLSRLPGLDTSAITNVQDAIDDFLFDLTQR